MSGDRRLRTSTLVLAALLLFGTLNALSGNAAGWAQPPGRADAAVGVVGAAGAAAVVTPPAAFDTRLLSEARAEQGLPSSGHDGLSAAGSLGLWPGPSGRRAAAALERAAHPERRSGTRLRGPPGLPI